ncbi:MAG TPA: NAD(P)-dependent oxidoreductase, partial [Rhizomicrobium sp.]|nr:NAD(P)-dependent oxidoreductase [Rhizomicrobium sp.]
MTALHPLRAAVIGAGPAACLLHLPILARLQRKAALVLVHVCDLNEKCAVEAQRKFGFQSHGGDAATAASRSDIDVVYVFGSAQMHYEYGLIALQNGKHIFVEKPIAPSFAEAQALAASARARSLIAVGGHNRRFYKALEVAREEAGKAGWRYAEAIAHKPGFGKTPPFGARTWLTANGIHALDVLLYMMGGFPETVAAFAGGGDPPGTFSAIMCWKNGAQGVFLCDNNAGTRREEYAFHAPGVSYSVTSDGLTINRRGRMSKIAAPIISDGFEAEHLAFLKSVREGIEPPHAISALAPSLFLAERIEANFQGTLRLPYICVPPGRAPAKGAVLVMDAESLSSPLARLLPRYRLVSLADIRDKPGPFPDVKAAVLGRGAPPLDDDILNKLPCLGAVGIAGLSLTRYRPDDLLRRGIILFNASAAYAQTVADFAFALAVLGRRRAFVSHEIMRHGGWGSTAPAKGPKGMLRQAGRRLRPAFRVAGLEPVLLQLWRKAATSAGASSVGLASRDMKGATVGLIGWGANATAFARRLHGAGARVIVWSEHTTTAELEGVAPASLNEALAADIVSLHRGLTPATRHFLGAAELARLRPGTVLINIARGALIEPNALLD